MNPYLDDPEGNIQGIQDIRKPKTVFDFMQPYQSSKAASAMLGNGVDSGQDPQAMDSEAYQRYKQLLLQPAPSEAIIQSMQASRPKREDYEPNTMTKILAAMSGFTAGTKNPVAGVATAKKMLDQPYEDALGDYNTDNQGKLEAARMQDSAFNRKLTSSQFDLNEERQRRAGIASQKDKETQRQLKQNEDINKIDEGLTKDANEKAKLSNETRKTDAEIGELNSKTGYYNSRNDALENPDESTKPVDILRNEKINTAEDKQAQHDAAKHLYENVPGYDSMMEASIDTKTGQASYSPTDEVANDPQKMKSLLTAIDQTSKALQTKNPGKKRRYRSLR